MTKPHTDGVPAGLLPLREDCTQPFSHLLRVPLDGQHKLSLRVSECLSSLLISFPPFYEDIDMLDYGLPS